MTEQELDKLNHEAERIHRLVSHARRLRTRAKCQRDCAGRLMHVDSVHGLVVQLSSMQNLELEISPGLWRTIRELLVHDLREQAAACEQALAQLTSADDVSVDNT